MHECLFGSNCWISCFMIFVAWWLMSAGLLTLTWNHVIHGLASKVKLIKYWQALLFVATIIVFCAPKQYLRHHYYSGFYCCHGQKEHCPYAHGEHEGGVEKQPEQK